MVFEGEYLTLDGKSRRTSGHVFVDYIPGSVVYHFTNLIAFAALVAVVNGMDVTAWIGLMIGIVCHL